MKPGRQEVDARRLRIGVVVSRSGVPAWITSLLREIVSNTSLQPVAAVFYQEKESRRVGPFLSRCISRFDKWLFRPRPDAKALSPASAEVFDAFPSVLRIEGVEEETKPAVWTALRECNLDVVLWLAAAIPNSKLTSCARSGVWWLEAGKRPLGASSIQVFVPPTGERAALRTRLLAQVEGSRSIRVLGESRCAAHPFSVSVTTNRVLWNAQAVVLRALSALQLRGRDMIHEGKAGEPCRSDRECSQHQGTPAGRASENPKSRLRSAARYLLLKARQKLRPDHWGLLVSAGDTGGKGVANWRHLAAPSGRFWADPHIVERDGKYFVFVEEYLYETHKAHISVLVLDSGGVLLERIRVLQRPYHLSYPFLFEFDGELFMIPETSANATVEAYRCVDFPSRWRLERVLMTDVFKLDSTLVEHLGRWWLFAGGKTNVGADQNQELHLYWSDHPLSKRWNAHPLNPVVSDVTRARPAGRFLTKGECLYRPGQDCSVRYGYGVRFHEVVELDPRSYEETEVCNILPETDSGIRGFHTYASGNGIRIVDARITRGFQRRTKGHARR